MDTNGYDHPSYNASYTSITATTNGPTFGMPQGADVDHQLTAEMAGTNGTIPAPIDFQSNVTQSLIILEARVRALEAESSSQLFQLLHEWMEALAQTVQQYSSTAPAQAKAFLQQTFQDAMAALESLHVPYALCGVVLASLPGLLNQATRGKIPILNTRFVQGASSAFGGTLVIKLLGMSTAYVIEQSTQLVQKARGALQSRQVQRQVLVVTSGAAICVVCLLWFYQLHRSDAVHSSCGSGDGSRFGRFAFPQRNAETIEALSNNVKALTVATEALARKFGSNVGTVMRAAETTAPSSAVAQASPTHGPCPCVHIESKVKEFKQRIKDLVSNL